MRALLRVRINWLITLLLSTAVAGYACKCVPVPPVITNMRAMAEWQSSGVAIVFEGRVEQIELKDLPHRLVPGRKLSEPFLLAILRTTRVHRGTLPDIVTVVMGMGGGDCGFEFESGHSYLVYADVGEFGQLSASVCSGTQPLDGAGAYLRVLRREPPSPGDMADLSSRTDAEIQGKICGQVLAPQDSHMAMNVLLWRPRSYPLPFLGPEDNIQATADGTFCFANVKPGRYLLQAQSEQVAGDAKPRKPEATASRFVGFYPAGTRVSQATPVEVKNEPISGLKIAVVQQLLHTARGHVEGTGRGEAGSVWTRVVLEESDKDLFYEMELAEAEADGSFKLDAVPSGHYSVIAYVMDRDREVLLSVSPQIDLDITSNIEDLVFRLQPSITFP
jgi:hypothetical protein